MGAGVLRFSSNPMLLVPDPNPMVAASVARNHQGAESHGTLMVGNLKKSGGLEKAVPFGIFHADHPPVYNLRLTRPETLESWVDSLHVNFMGTPLPMPYPAGAVKFGLPSLPSLSGLSLPTIGLPSIPWPNISLPLLAALQKLMDLVAWFLTLNSPIPPFISIMIAAILNDLIKKLKLAFPAISLTMPIEWFANLIFQMPLLQIPSILGNLLSFPAIAWPVIALLPQGILLHGPLPAIPGVDSAALRSLLDTLISAFTDWTGRVGAGFKVFLGFLASLADSLAGFIAALIANLNINISFPFPGIDLGQLPPAGTPWPAPWSPTSIVPLISWPSWMTAPIMANVPMSLPPGTGMAAAGPGCFAYTSVPGYYFQSQFVVKAKSSVTPGLYMQELFLEGSLSPTGVPTQKLGRITVCAQVLEDTLAPGIRPMGVLGSGGGVGAEAIGVPLMNRDDQFSAAPQKKYESEHHNDNVYVPGTELYPLPEGVVASALTAVQVYGGEPTDFVRGEGFEDIADATGNGPLYLVRLWRDVQEGMTHQQIVALPWLEEALIPGAHYSAELVEDVYDAQEQRVKHRIKITWSQPVQADPENPTPSTEWAEWETPLGTPAEYIELGDLPSATPPAQPRHPAVPTRTKYRLYCAGIVNTTGAVLNPAKTAVDLTNCVPRPQAGPLIFHYLVADGNVNNQ
jgi:hypothetical protein